MRIHAGSTGDSVDGRQQSRHWTAPCGINGIGSAMRQQQRYAAAAGSMSDIIFPRAVYVLYCIEILHRSKTS